MFFLIIVTLIFGYIIFKHVKCIQELPPGPLPLPYLGNIPSFLIELRRHKRVAHIYKYWKNKYGPVYTVWLGPLPAVFITDYNLAVENMVKKGSLFVDRQNFYLFDILKWGRGIVNANGDGWHEQRRFALTTLRDFGLGKNIMEERIMSELDLRVEQLNKEIEKNGGSVQWNPLNFINLTVGNIINRLLFSKRFDEKEEEQFFRLKEEMDKMLKDLSPLDIILNDWNKDLPLFKQRYRAMINCLQPIFDFIRKQVEEKKEQMETKGESADDYADAFLQHMKKEDVGESFDEENLVISLFDLWMAGQETTTVTIYWAFAYLILNPNVLSKLQIELDNVTNGSRWLKQSDKLQTPYLNAVILEVLRVSAIIPANLWRIAAEDTSIGSYGIKKGTVCAMQMSVIMSDEENFKEPDLFNPDRFLEGEAEQRVLPFSLGKRSCLGEAMARAELYLIIGNLVRLYKMEPVQDHLPKMEAMQEDGALRTPFPYQIIVSKR